MKRLISLLLIVFLFAGCSAKTYLVDKDDSLKNTEDVQNDLSQQTIEDEVKVTEEHEKMKLVVERGVYNQLPYPKFKNLNKEQEVNQLILNYISEINNLYNESGTLKLDYQIMFQNDQYLSILFSGELNEGAYPSLFKSTLNINLKKGVRMTLNQMVNLNDAFIEEVTNAIENQFISMGVDMDAVMPLGVKDKILNADNQITSDIQSYVTPEAIVMILSVPHIIGDYLEVSVPISSVETFIH